MENIKSIESNYKKRNHNKKINSSKNRKRKRNLFGKEDDEIEEITIGPENTCRKRKIKFNSIDTSHVLHNNFFRKHPSTYIGKKEKNNNKKNGYEVTEYLTKLYDEPHLSKSLFKKKTTKIRNLNRKVSFLNPTNFKSKKSVNILKLNKSLNNKNSNNFNYNKSRIFNDDDILEKKSYRDNKAYAPYLMDSNDIMPKSEIITDKKLFNTRNLRRRQTSKTNKTNNKRLLNLYKLRNPDKKNTDNTNNTFYNLTKKHLSSKSNNKKLKKKENKTIKNKNNKDKDYESIININNNIHINNDLEKSINKNDDDFEITKKNIKKQDVEDIETAIQKEQKENNEKKKKKQFCCFPFLVCLKIKNEEENENIL